nr:retrotransposon protein, putative, Ty3-gypsy subclass [Tanacetum cinerariifolium]
MGGASCSSMMTEDVEGDLFSKYSLNIGPNKLSKSSFDGIVEVSADESSRGKVIAYASRQLKIHEKNYTTHDLELGVVMFALEIWRHYLYGTKSVIYTNHKSLQYIFDQTELNMRQRRWIELLSDYECDLKYHPGKANVVADALNKMYYDLRDLYCDSQRFKMERLARIYINDIVVRHGVPVSIISNRDGRFSSPFWRALQKTFGIRLDMSTSYHPQTDGQSERTIQTLEDMLRECETIKKIMQIKERLKTARDHQKSYADKRRKPLEFKVRDQVLLKVSPCKGVVRFDLQVPLEEIKIDEKLYFVEEPVEIANKQVKKLKRSWIPIVKVRWDSQRGAEFTWEREDQFKAKYPYLFATSPSATVFS